MRRQLLLGALAVATLVAVVGCGGNGSAEKPPERLSPDEQATLESAQQAVHRYCRKVGLYILRRGGPPTEADLEQVDARLQALVQVGREKPSALSPSQRTIRESIGDLVEDVEGSNCSGPVQERLNTAIAELPRP